jgi:glycosyltransferase involved in cell wall biosynthesis
MTTVLHVLHTWGQPSETFVRSLVAATPRTRSVVVAHDRLGSGPGQPPVHTLARLRARLPGPLAGKASVAAAVRIARRERAEVVHSHFAHEVLLADRVARLLRRPHVVSLHGRDLLVELDHRPDALAAVRRAAAVIVPSPFLAAAAAERGVDPARIAVIPSGVELDELPFRARTAGDLPPLVLFIGRFVEKKGVLDAAAALVAVAADHPLRARFVGVGELAPQLSTALAPLGAAASVVDGSNRQAVLGALAEGDLLISPSRTADDGDAETLHLVNVEAQASGIPVLTTAHGGIPSGLGPGAAVVVPEGDGPALAQALAELVDHPERWAMMGQAGRAFVEANLTVTHTRTNAEMLYDALITGQPLPSALRWAGADR